MTDVYCKDVVFAGQGSLHGIRANTREETKYTLGKSPLCSLKSHSYLKPPLFLPRLEAKVFMRMQTEMLTPGSFTSTLIPPHPYRNLVRTWLPCPAGCALDSLSLKMLGECICEGLQSAVIMVSFQTLSGCKIFSSSKILALAHPFMFILPRVARFSIEDANTQNECPVCLLFRDYLGPGTSTRRCAMKWNSEFPRSVSSFELIWLKLFEDFLFLQLLKMVCWTQRQGLFIGIIIILTNMDFLGPALIWNLWLPDVCVCVCVSACTVDLLLLLYCELFDIEDQDSSRPPPQQCTKKKEKTKDS